MLFIFAAQSPTAAPACMLDTMDLESLESVPAVDILLITHVHVHTQALSVSNLKSLSHLKYNIM